jgi:hypothetical protein
MSKRATAQDLTRRVRTRTSATATYAAAVRKTAAAAELEAANAAAASAAAELEAANAAASAAAELEAANAAAANAARTAAAEKATSLAANAARTAAAEKATSLAPDRTSSGTMDSDTDDVSVTEMFSTTSLPAMVFAVAGAVLLPSADVAQLTTGLLRMINANRPEGSAEIWVLPGLVELFQRLEVPIALTDKAGSTTLFPPAIANDHLRQHLSHNGRGTRIGSTLETVRDPAWPLVTQSDMSAGVHITLATFGLRRFGPWKVPGEDLDFFGDRNMGASRKRQLPTPCVEYTQGPSNADACVACGLPSKDHASPKGSGGGASPPRSHYSDRSELQLALSGDSPMSSSMASVSSHTVVAQPAQKLWMWSKFGYSDWKLVRDAARLAQATGTHDHQKHHITEEMRQVLSAYCDKFAGAKRENYGKALLVLNAKPLGEWITVVDSMMRKEFKIPVFDELDLVLKKDHKGRPLLDEFRANFILFANQENYHEEKDLLAILRGSIEKNFLELSRSVLEPCYRRWRQQGSDLQRAVFEVCEALQPFTDRAVKLGSAGPRGGDRGDWKKFFCVNCKANDSHDTADCPDGTPQKCKHCKSSKHRSRDCPTTKRKFCTICKTHSHSTEDCRKSGTGPDATKEGVKDPKDTTPGGTPGATAGLPYKHGKDKSGKSKPPEGYTCRTCGIPGHWRSDCPKK